MEALFKVACGILGVAFAIPAGWLMVRWGLSLKQIVGLCLLQAISYSFWMAARPKFFERRQRASASSGDS